MKIGKLEKAKLKEWMRETEGSYDVMIALLSAYKTALQMEEVTGENEFQTLRELHIKQGKVAGVKEFFEQIEREVE